MDKAALRETFFQAKLKVYRANRHIQEAEAVFGQYLASDFCRIVIERNPETGHQLVKAVAEPIPADLVLSVGDAFHCLSASLDYVMSGVMRAETGETKRITFPTDESREALRKTFMAAKKGRGAPRNRRICEAFPCFVFDLLTGIKPYKGGDFLLWEVRKADNIDKHNLLIPTVTITRLSNVSMIDEVNQNSFAGMSFELGPGGTINAIAYGMADELKVQDKGNPSAKITFPEGAEVFSGKPVFPTLRECSHLVAEAVARMERHFTAI